MVNKLLVGFSFLVVVLLAGTIVSASIEVTTEIKVKTKPDHQVFLSILDNTKSDFYAHEVLSGVTDECGLVTFYYTSDEIYEFDLGILVKSGEKRVLKEEYRNDYYAGDVIEVEAYPENYEPVSCGEILNETVVNDTIIEVENLEINETENLEETPKSIVTGFSINEVTNSPFTYIVVIVLLVIGFGLFYFSNKKKTVLEKNDFSKKESAPRIGSLESESSSGMNINDDLTSAERKLIEAQKEVSRIKNEKRIEDIRRKIESDENELKRLRGEK